VADKTVTVKSSGGDYTTLAAAITGEVTANANLVTMAGILHINDYLSSDTTTVNVNGFTTSSSYYVDISMDSSVRHAGYYDSTKGKLEVNDAWNPALTVTSNYTRLTGFQIGNTSEGGDRGALRVDGSYCIIRDCIGYDGFEFCFWIWGGSDNYVINCIATGSTKIGFAQVYSYRAIFINCVAVHNGTRGFSLEDALDFTAINCYAGGNGTVDFYRSAQNNGEIITCFSADGSESTTVVALSTTSGAYFSNVTAGSENLHITSTSSGLYHTGTNEYSVFTTDIDGDARPASTAWCVGIDEYSGSSSVELAGVIAATSTLSGTLSVGKPLAGTIAASTTLAGALRVQKQLTGSIVASSSLAGALRVVKNLAGQVVASSSLAGALHVATAYTLTYNGNGNDGGTAPTDASSPYEEAENFTVLGNTGGLTLSGYVFTGWNSAANGTGSHYSPGGVYSMPGAALTLYVQWSEAGEGSSHGKRTRKAMWLLVEGGR